MPEQLNFSSGKQNARSSFWNETCISQSWCELILYRLSRYSLLIIYLGFNLELWLKKGLLSVTVQITKLLLCRLDFKFCYEPHAPCNVSISKIGVDKRIVQSIKDCINFSWETHWLCKGHIIFWKLCFTNLNTMFLTIMFKINMQKLYGRYLWICYLLNTVNMLNTESFSHRSSFVPLFLVIICSLWFSNVARGLRNGVLTWTGLTLSWLRSLTCRS